MNICKLFKQGKRNAQTVPTTLGEGSLGYLALYIKTVLYNTIPNSTPFVLPIDLGVFSPTNPIGLSMRMGGPDPLTPTETATQKIAHGEQKREYNEVHAVETVLRKQLIHAFKDVYLQPLRGSCEYSF